MEAVHLSAFPGKGERRKLDRLWLAKLHTDGTAALLPCLPEIPRELDLAIDQFNRKRFWECHETLEHIWLSEPYPLRLFYQGLIKAAVGLFHLYRHNRHGARSKLSDAVYTLAPFVPEMMGVDVTRLRSDMSERLALIQDDRFSDWTSIERLSPVLIQGC
jgi:hypothetical protein